MTLKMFKRFFCPKGEKVVMPIINISVDSIEKKSNLYASMMVEELGEYPVNVDPVVAGRAHRMGYVKGAMDVVSEIEKTMEAIPEMTPNYHIIVYHEILHTLMMLKGKQE